MAMLKKDTTIDGNKAWHSGNDGSGSGLDADLLDGLDKTNFLRSNKNDVFQGVLTINNPNQDFNYIEVLSTDNKKLYMFNDGDVLKLDAFDDGNSVALDFDIGGNGGNPNLKGIPTVNGNKIWHEGDGLASLAANGYQKLPSGLIIQWGSADVPAASYTDFTLPVSYPTAYQAVVMLDIDNNNGSNGVRSHIVSNSTIRLYNVDDGGTYTIRFMAIGY